MTTNRRGFGLIEVLAIVALLAVVGMTAASSVNNALNANRIATARAVSVALADALRTQLSRRQTCAPSFNTAPVASSYGGAPNTPAASSEVAIGIGADAVAAGAELPDYNLGVVSLTTQITGNLGSTTTGNGVYLADLVLRGQSPVLNSGNRFQLKAITVARMVLEVDGGGALVGCEAGDPASDQRQQYDQLCSSIASPDGVPGAWSGGRCVVPDASGATKCGQLGGTWSGSRCSIAPQVFVSSRLIDFGAAGNTYYGVNCPAGSGVTGVACYSQNGPFAPLGTALFGNGAFCWWPSGYETTQFMVQATCAVL